jgi:Uncharacterized conserved protein
LVYDYYQEKGKKGFKKQFVLGAIVAVFIVILIAANNIYLEILQLNEIGNHSGVAGSVGDYSSVYIKNLIFKLATFAVCFLLIFIVISISNFFIKKNMNSYLRKKELPIKHYPNFLVSAVVAFFGALISKDLFYMKILNYFNGSSFNAKDPIFNNDVGYYVFTRPLYTTIIGFLSGLCLFVIAYTIIYYLIIFSTAIGNMSLQDLKEKSIVRHILINLALFFIVKSFSYQFIKQDILFGNVVEYTGAGYVDVNVWLKYYTVMPFLLIAIVIVSMFFVWKDKLKTAAVAIAIFPAVWIIVSGVAFFIEGIIVNPNEYKYENSYIASNISSTRTAYGLDKIKTYDFPSTQKLTPEIISRNTDTKNNIRVVDIPSTLISNVQLQSNTAFYTFNDGDIINYNVNGKDIPVFISAREIDKSKLPDKTYLNTTYRYTHGYGIVMNPINKLTRDGQVESIIGGLDSTSVDSKLSVTRPQIYYGEMTMDHVIVKSQGLDEIDYDGTRTTVYNGEGGIKLNFLNKLLFSIKYGDFKMLISGYTSNSTLLLNRQIVDRAQKAVPFLTVDKDPYILVTDDGKLKWVLDAYTTSDKYPYSQYYGDVNYIRNSVKIVIDAYDGKVSCYIIDDKDPIIKAYESIYPDVFSKEKLPDFLAKHMRYPEQLFAIQTEMLNNYHILPENVSTFYSKNDLWAVARYSKEKGSANLTEIEPYYNMIKLPGGIGDKEELILMRPFTPSGELKHNMVSWLAVRNSNENYNEMILFNFPKSTNILGPNQVEVKINQIDKISSDMTLWGQGGSDAYKGNLLVIPIENSILYVEPIYLRSTGSSSSPEVKEIVVGYQNGEEFRYGIGSNLDKAIADLFSEEIPTITTPTEGNKGNQGQQPQTTIDKQKLADITKKYEELKKQLDELGDLLNSLK